MYSTALQGGPDAAGMRRPARVREDDPSAALRTGVATLAERLSDGGGRFCLGVFHYRRRETRVIAKVGDTLRIWNDDTEPHQPQSDGGTPYSQPESSIAPGSSADFPLRSPFQPGPGHQLYDHVNGPGAAF